MATYEEYEAQQREKEKQEAEEEEKANMQDELANSDSDEDFWGEKSRKKKMRRVTQRRMGAPFRVTISDMQRVRETCDIDFNSDKTKVKFEYLTVRRMGMSLPKLKRERLEWFAENVVTILSKPDIASDDDNDDEPTPWKPITKRVLRRMGMPLNPIIDVIQVGKGIERIMNEIDDKILEERAYRLYSAARIQAAWRMYVQRDVYLELREASLIVQKYFRAYNFRRKRKLAAKVIQREWRKMLLTKAISEEKAEQKAQELEREFKWQQEALLKQKKKLKTKKKHLSKLKKKKEKARKKKEKLKAEELQKAKEKEEKEAAIVLQKEFRRYYLQKIYIARITKIREVRRKAATDIQRVWRGKMGRRRFRKIRRDKIRNKDQEKRVVMMIDEAAITVQRWYRGHMARVEIAKYKRKQERRRRRRIEQGKDPNASSSEDEDGKDSSEEEEDPLTNEYWSFRRDNIANEADRLRKELLKMSTVPLAGRRAVGAGVAPIKKAPALPPSVQLSAKSAEREMQRYNMTRSMAFPWIEQGKYHLRRRDAAARIQAQFRGRRQRKLYEKMRASAIKIQSRFRGALSRFQNWFHNPFKGLRLKDDDIKKLFDKKVLARTGLAKFATKKKLPPPPRERLQHLLRPDKIYKDKLVGLDVFTNQKKFQRREGDNVLERLDELKEKTGFDSAVFGLSRRLEDDIEFIKQVLKDRIILEKPGELGLKDAKRRERKKREMKNVKLGELLGPGRVSRSGSLASAVVEEVQQLTGALKSLHELEVEPPSMEQWNWRGYNRGARRQQTANSTPRSVDSLSSLIELAKRANEECEYREKVELGLIEIDPWDEEPEAPSGLGGRQLESAITPGTPNTAQLFASYPNSPLPSSSVPPTPSQEQLAVGQGGEAVAERPQTADTAGTGGSTGTNKSKGTKSSKGKDGEDGDDAGGEAGFPSTFTTFEGEELVVDGERPKSTQSMRARPTTAESPLTVVTEFAEAFPEEHSDSSDGETHDYPHEEPHLKKPLRRPSLITIERSKKAMNQVAELGFVGSISSVRYRETSPPKKPIDIKSFRKKTPSRLLQRSTNSRPTSPESHVDDGLGRTRGMLPQLAEESLSTEITRARRKGRKARIAEPEREEGFDPHDEPTQVHYVGQTAIVFDDASVGSRPNSKGYPAAIWTSDSDSRPTTSTTFALSERESSAGGLPRALHKRWSFSEQGGALPVSPGDGDKLEQLNEGAAEVEERTVTDVGDGAEEEPEGGEKGSSRHEGEGEGEGVGVGTATGEGDVADGDMEVVRILVDDGYQVSESIITLDEEDTTLRDAVRSKIFRLLTDDSVEDVPGDRLLPVGRKKQLPAISTPSHASSSQSPEVGRQSVSPDSSREAARPAKRPTSAKLSPIPHSSPSPQRPTTSHHGQKSDIHSPFDVPKVSKSLQKYYKVRNVVPGRALAQASATTKATTPSTTARKKIQRPSYPVPIVGSEYKNGMLGDLQSGARAQREKELERLGNEQDKLYSTYMEKKEEEARLISLLCKADPANKKRIADLLAPPPGVGKPQAPKGFSLKSIASDSKARQKERQVQVEDNEAKLPKSPREVSVGEETEPHSIHQTATLVEETQDRHRRTTAEDFDRPSSRESTGSSLSRRATESHLNVRPASPMSRKLSAGAIPESSPLEIEKKTKTSKEEEKATDGAKKHTTAEDFDRPSSRESTGSSLSRRATESHLNVRPASPMSRKLSAGAIPESSPLEIEKNRDEVAPAEAGQAKDGVEDVKKSEAEDNTMTAFSEEEVQVVTNVDNLDVGEMESMSDVSMEDQKDEKDESNSTGDQSDYKPSLINDSSIEGTPVKEQPAPASPTVARSTTGVRGLKAEVMAKRASDMKEVNRHLERLVGDERRRVVKLIKLAEREGVSIERPKVPYAV